MTGESSSKFSTKTANKGKHSTGIDQEKTSITKPEKKGVFARKKSWFN
ncbi:hypothetical protein QUF70_17125 [Desulfobacterales bacterium HSG17]|nr:hypothetical protein [Desulfobacterales bacterium HSG17]